MAKSAAPRKLNVKLLRKIQKHILAEPRRLNMGLIVEREAERYFREQAPPCGTICCIGGWANVLSGVRRKDEDDLQIAAKKLGIKYERGSSQAYRLFFDDEWPKKFEAQLWAANTPRGRASVTSRRIDHFIKTKGAE